MDGLTLETLRTLDEQAKRLGFDERTLIENASSNLCAVIESLRLGKRVLAVAGRGNNGADVLSCARKLAGRGYAVSAAVLDEKPLGPQVLWQKNVLEALGIRLFSLKGANTGILPELMADRDFILDGILGIGIRHEVDPFLRQVITMINESGKTIVACDVPSGLSPDQGTVLGAAIRADYTVSFIAAKKGFFLNQGPEHCGKIFIVDIGISRQMLEASTDNR